MSQQAVSVNNEVILVTGAFGLIGGHISKLFLQQGAKVILADINKAMLESVRAEYAALFNQDDFLITELDITSEKSCAAVIQQTIEKFGRLDTLINNAAIDAKFDKTGLSGVDQNRFEHYPVDLLRRSVEVNLTGTVIITQAACRQMLKQGNGNIINVASTYSVVAPNQSLYDFGDGVQQYKPVDYIASKSFVPNFTRYIATFYANNNIRCNAIVPHGILNNHSEAFQHNFSKMSPLGRMCNKEELDGPFLMLASKSSSYMTGSVLMVDGGWTAW